MSTEERIPIMPALEKKMRAVMEFMISEHQRTGYVQVPGEPLTRAAQANWNRIKTKYMLDSKAAS